jgi:hypothetical protein
MKPIYNRTRRVAPMGRGVGSAGRLRFSATLLKPKHVRQPGAIQVGETPRDIQIGYASFVVVDLRRKLTPARASPRRNRLGQG